MPDFFKIEIFNGVVELTQALDIDAEVDDEDIIYLYTLSIYK